MWARCGLPEPDRRVTNAEYKQTLAAIFGYSSPDRLAGDVREDRERKAARMAALLQRLGDPQSDFPIVLVAGTKGKGSTAAMLAGMLRASGLRVGRYTQPHLVSWRERTWVNGSYLSVPETIALFPQVRSSAEAVHRHAPWLGPITTFEVGTALSLLSFRLAGVDIAVVEVGVGGRHDATNALDPIVSVITPISFDHVDVIGPTIADIAYEKAGVMRPGRPVILGRQPADARATLKTEAREVGARDAWLQSEWAWSLRGEHLHVQGPEIAIDGLAVPLRGTFQCDNATAAVAALCATGMVAPEMVDQAVRGGLQSLSWPGRVHVVNQAPIVVFDGAHNAESADQLVSALQSSFGKRRAHWLLGMSRGKDVQGFLDAVTRHAASITTTTASHERSVGAEDLAALARGMNRTLALESEVTAIPSPVDAYRHIMKIANEEDLVCAAGSFFLLGDLYSELD